ncbi:MAG: type II toxin-antitoxin system RelE/ParE family toxin [Sphingomonadaceae bacterium]
MVFEIRQTEIFRHWLDHLKDRIARARIQVRIDRAEGGNFGDHKLIGGGIAEMRVDYGAGYRIYCTCRDAQLVILLAGGDKSSQPRDIQLARKLAQKL